MHTDAKCRADNFDKQDDEWVIVGGGEEQEKV